MAEPATTDLARPVQSISRPDITRLRIDGMTCGNCARHVTEALQSVAGVQSANVALESQSAQVRWAPGALAKPEELVRAAVEAGYEAKAVGGEQQETAGAASGWKLNLLLGVAVTVPLAVGEWILGLGVAPWFRGSSLVLAALVQVVGGAPFYRG